MKKYIFIPFFLLGAFIYSVFPKDIVVAQVRPLNVTQTQVNAVIDTGNGICFSETYINDKELQTGESITAKEQMRCSN
jgi:hypothetical protein